MIKTLSLLAASAFALASGGVLAADPPKDTAPAKKEAAPAAPQKPADVTAEAWAKMTDAEKAKAADKAKAGDKSKTAAPAKKEKKGGC
jgi:hypothetical protein